MTELGQPNIIENSSERAGETTPQAQEADQEPALSCAHGIPLIHGQLSAYCQDCNTIRSEASRTIRDFSANYNKKWSGWQNAEAVKRAQKPALEALRDIYDPASNYYQELQSGLDNLNKYGRVKMSKGMMEDWSEEIDRRVDAEQKTWESDQTLRDTLVEQARQTLADMPKEYIAPDNDAGPSDPNWTGTALD